MKRPETIWEGAEWVSILALGATTLAGGLTLVQTPELVGVVTHSPDLEVLAGRVLEFITARIAYASLLYSLIALGMSLPMSGMLGGEQKNQINTALGLSLVNMAANVLLGTIEFTN